MGDIADQMLNGELCQGCGGLLDGIGYPTFCRACQIDMNVNEHGEKTKPVKKKVKCTECGKKVMPEGMINHLRDVHGIIKRKGVR